MGQKHTLIPLVMLLTSSIVISMCHILIIVFNYCISTKAYTYTVYIHMCMYTCIFIFDRCSLSSELFFLDL